MAKTALRDRALTSFDRPLITEVTHLSASGTVCAEACLLFHASAYQTASGNNTFMRIRVNDSSGTIVWFISRGGQGTEAQDFEGVYFATGMYADFTSSGGTFGGSFEFLRIRNIPWFRPGMDEADIMEAFARAAPNSKINPLGQGSGGGGGGGNARPIAPPSGGPITGGNIGGGS